MTELTKFFVDHNAPDYYYIKKSTPAIELGTAPHTEQLADMVAYCEENKNPLNLIVTGTNLLAWNIQGYPTDFYSWPIPYCFTWEAYQAGSVEGVTLYRIAKEFWDSIASIKVDPDHPEGFKVLNADLKLFPAGARTQRQVSNPGGPKSLKWMEGGSCRLLIPLTAPAGAKILSGSINNPSTLEPVVNTVYEFNNTIPFTQINDSTEDFIFLEVDLVPASKATEAETRILESAIFSQLHVTFASGFPVHPTLHL